ncbi:SGNH/GDSL hydrolase family protein [Boudabousia marimammalium]|uniref:SGNH hydrolase-type esterase domain-containing protein n=1 Tax=Boudabousia marimammalium TaxID=156892 RepID=A0A1Q5PJ96_9ACTO|nr:SGNH/GDSL hydrolase family protein [Boudabousia marimammalium]OKL45915.1 hypothetical protein BM477_07880 [Boudabousia marimammalium]
MIKPLDISKIGSYVAIGDSFSEGMMDPWASDPHLAESAVGEYRGWTDRLASKLSRIRVDEDLPPVRYANLAVRGKLLHQIVAEQLDPAIEMLPDLLSIVGGGNDMLRPGATPDTVAELLEEAVSRARHAGCEVLLVVSSNPRGGSRLLSATRGQASVFNSYIWSIAHRYDCYVADQWGLQALQTWPAWAADRIHLTSTGHEIMAREALHALGLEARINEDSRPLPLGEDPIPSEVPISEAIPAGWAQVQQGFRDDFEWLRRDVKPWVGRRIKGVSSGDEVRAKRPRLQEMPPQPHDL